MAPRLETISGHEPRFLRQAAHGDRHHTRLRGILGAPAHHLRLRRLEPG